MSGAIPIGALRHLVTHLAPVSVPDGFGGASVTFVAVDRLWAAVEESAAGAFADERRFGLAGVRVTVRAPNTLKAGDILRHGTRRLAVEATCDPDGRGRYTRAMCREEQT
ncbi:putative phage head-tail adaptor [Azorhizobium caulinodans ORS 571]|uniref:Putative phage head-tail adaptor n=1 Tax=Azorhizobium caulinodans (strain ATCC 43989 / DSM 5975 / JCM 20966 / LMG 6465 / NBRC 14845 / NCIMB 13405 / ORS 571) TaxID=438753 RepID=A8HR44_AZOC5|nr:head-tail adaptor protein [Azorhizobium caulinodans]BAF87114.1 putative phage head-tail adaptor [Azorhizobium caulinodans ORS 571]